MIKLIMLVEDDDTIRETLSVVIDQMGCRPYPAATTDEALDGLKTFRPDLILLDYIFNTANIACMPVEKFVKLVRELPPPLIPIVLITATDKPQSVADRLQVDGLVKKPFSLEEICEAIDLFTGLEDTKGQRAI